MSDAFSPLSLAGMSEDDVRTLANKTGYNVDQLMQDRQQALDIANPEPANYGTALPPQPGPQAAMGLDLARVDHAPQNRDLAHQAEVDTAHNAYVAGSTAQAQRNEMAAVTAQAEENAKALAAARQNAPPMQAQRPMGGGGVMGALDPKESLDALKEQTQASELANTAHYEKQAEAQKRLAQAEHDAQMQMAQNRLEQAQRQQDILHARNEAEDAQRAYAEGKVDPDRFYRNEDGTTNYGRKIGAAIAVAMGAFGAALNKGPNYAMEIINGAIERDIASQREALSKQRDVAQQKKQDVKDLLTSDEHLANQADIHRIQALQDARQQVADFMGATTSDEHKAQLQQLDAGLLQQQAQTKDQYQIRNGEIRARNRQLAMEQQRIDLAGQRGPAKEDVEHAKKVQAAQLALQAVMKRNEESGTAISPSARAAGEAEQHNLMAALADLKGTKIGERNKAFFEELAGANPATLGATLRKGKYKALLQDIQNEARLGSRGGAGLGTPDEGD